METENLIIGGGLSAFAVAAALAHRSLPFIIACGMRDPDGPELPSSIADYKNRNHDQAKLFNWARQSVPNNGAEGFEFYFNPSPGGLAEYWAGIVPPNLVALGERFGIDDKVFEELDDLIHSAKGAFHRSGEIISIKDFPSRNKATIFLKSTEADRAFNPAACFDELSENCTYLNASSILARDADLVCTLSDGVKITAKRIFICAGLIQSTCFAEDLLAQKSKKTNAISEFLLFHNPTFVMPSIDLMMGLRPKRKGALKGVERHISIINKSGLTEAFVQQNNFDYITPHLLFYDAPVPFLMVRLFRFFKSIFRIHIAYLPCLENRFWLTVGNGKISVKEIEGFGSPQGWLLKLVWRLLVSGRLAMPFAGKWLAPGRDIHAAGTLGRRINGDGELPELKNIHFCDMASMPFLPAENSTVLMMARAVQYVDRIFSKSSSAG